MYAFPDFHAPAIHSPAETRIVAAIARAQSFARIRSVTDHGPRVQDNGRARTWRERLNRAAFAARSRVTFRAPELETRAALESRRIRCEVFSERNGCTGRAVFH